MITDQISSAGTSIWLDDLSRSKITGVDPHSLPHHIAHDRVVGVTTNPSLFNSAISDGAEYAESIHALAGKTVDEIVQVLTTDDVRNACDLFQPAYEASMGVDGRVSIEVDPRLAKDTQGSIKNGRTLWSTVDRANVMIKIPATLEGLEAITTLISEGISVNVTLIFSIERYEQVFDAFAKGLEIRLAHGEKISNVTSVASFFVSRIDTEVDKRLKAIHSSDADALLGKAAIANATLAYKSYEKLIATPRWQNLAKQGAHVQRLLWASTGVKDPTYEDTRYVFGLIAPDTVNTMPQATLDAVMDHGVMPEYPLTSQYDAAEAILANVEKVGVSMKSVCEVLEVEGVKKFADAWAELLANVEKVRAA